MFEIVCSLGHAVLTILHIVGYSTRSWLQNNGTQGLWKICEYSAVYECCEPLETYVSDIPAFINATRAFESMGLILCVALGVWLIIVFTTDLKDGYIEVIYMLSICSGTCILLGIAIYGGRFLHDSLTSNYSLSYSFFLCMCSGIGLCFFPYVVYRVLPYRKDKSSSSSSNTGGASNVTTTTAQSSPPMKIVKINTLPPLNTSNRIGVSSNTSSMQKQPSRNQIQPIVTVQPSALQRTVNQNKLPPLKTSKSVKPINRKTLQKEDFVELYKSNVFPPRYWTHYDKTKTIKDWNLEKPKVERILVDGITESYIKRLVAKTWESKSLGIGKDAKGLNDLAYTNMEIKKIWRIENPTLFEKYGQHRQELFRKAQTTSAFKKLEDIPQAVEGPIQTTEYSGGALTDDIFPEINEHYLFHGTKPELVDSIVSQGLDCRLASKAALGNGVYAAECPTKADQYVDDKHNRNTTDMKTMILIRMLLGEIFVLKTRKEWKKPPCKKCLSDVCADPDHEQSGSFDSVVADGIWKYREFVVYDRGMCYPEYIIEYVRV